MNKYTINDITRASGGFAMLAVDQREAMRLMFAAAGAKSPVNDSVLTDFKVNAAKIEGYLDEMDELELVRRDGRNVYVRKIVSIF